MDIITALFKAADLTKPGTRNQLPIASIVLTIAALVAAGAPFRPPNFQGIVHTVGDLSAIGLTVLIFGVIAASILLQPLLTYLDLVLVGGEGTRWLGLLRWSRARQLRNFRKYADQITAAKEELQETNPVTPEEKQELRHQQAIANLKRARYPRDHSHLSATALGNILAAMEESAGGRYGLITSVVYPRLYASLPDVMVRSVSARQDDMRFAVHLASAFVVAALTSALLLLNPMVVVIREGWPQSPQRPFSYAPLPTWLQVLWFLLPLAAALLAWASYRNAVSAALGYSEQVSVAFDLHRFELYRALNMPVPNDSEAEQHIARAVNKMLTGHVEHVKYEHPETLDKNRA